MYRVSRTQVLNDDDHNELSDWLDKKYREKMLVGNADINDDKQEVLGDESMGYTILYR